MRCLLLSWKRDDLGCFKEVDRFEQLLGQHFGYTVDSWRIPSDDPYGQLRIRLESFIGATGGSSELLLVYYGGHGYIDDKTGCLKWVANNSSRAPELTWNSLQDTLLVPLEQDILTILDTCYAAGAFRGPVPGRKEIIAACGWESQAVGGIDNGTSFTAALMRTFRSYLYPFTMAEAYSELLTKHKDGLARTPIYSPLPGAEKASIVLTPKTALKVLAGNDNSKSVSKLSKTSEIKHMVQLDELLPLATRFGYTRKQALSMIQSEAFQKKTSDCEAKGYTREQAIAMILDHISRKLAVHKRQTKLVFGNTQAPELGPYALFNDSSESEDSEDSRGEGRRNV